MFDLQREDSLMSLAIPSDGRGRSGSGETQARPKATGPMTEKYVLIPNVNEKLYIILTHDQTLYASSVIILMSLQHHKVCRNI